MILGRPFCEQPFINKWLNFIFKVDDEINHRSGKSVRWKVGVLKNLTSSGEDKSCGFFCFDNDRLSVSVCLSPAH